MTAAQIKLVCNVIRMGGTLRLHWEAETGVKYRVRYAFGSLSGTAAEGVTTGSLEWTLDSNTFSTEMAGITMDGMLYLDTCDTAGNLLGTSQVDFTVAGANILIPSFSADYVNIGETVRMVVNSSNWIYSPGSNYPGYTCGNASGSIRLDYEGYLPTRWHSDWTPPISLAKEYPDQTSFYVEVTIETEYRNIVTSTSSVIGRVVCRLEVRVPENEATKPKTTLTTEAVSQLSSDFDGLYIRGKTKVRATLEASSEVSEIATATIQAGSEQVNGFEATFDLTGDSMTIRGTVTDKRGYGRTVSHTVQAMAYVPPGVVPAAGNTKIVCTRCTADGTPSQKGEFLLIQAKRRYTTIESGGRQLNKCTLRYRIRTVSGTFPESWVTLRGQTDADDAYSGRVANVILDAKVGYVVQIGAVDTVGEARSVSVPIPAVGVPFHVGKGNRNVSVGGFCDYSRKDVFDVYFTQYFFTGVAAQPVFEDGSWSSGTALESSVPGADTVGLDSYNLLIGVTGGVPVLLTKAGGMIAGGDIRILCDQGSMTLQSGGPITALYKLL